MFTVGANLLLAFWSDDPTASTDTSVRDFYLTAYGVMGGLQSLFIFFAVIVITFGTINASIKLHHQLLINILRSTMAFFDTTPTGRIVNRFSKDIDEVDIMLPMHIKDIFNQVLNVCGTVFVLSYANPFMLIVILPLTGFFFLVQVMIMMMVVVIMIMMSKTAQRGNNAISSLTITGSKACKADKASSG